MFQEHLILKEKINDLSAEIAVESYYIEKDWYITKILEILSGQDNLVFTGGTSLFKAHSMIERFSEDLDFLVTKKMLPAERKKHVAEIIKLIQEGNFKLIGEPRSFDSSKKYEISFGYQELIDDEQSIRPHILLEIVYEKTLDYPDTPKKIQSLISKYSIDNTEYFNINCTDPKQIFSDKVSALIWRIPHNHNKEQAQKFDNTVIRHLYDICRIYDSVSLNDDIELQALIVNKLENDIRKRDKSSGDITITDYCNKTVSFLNESEDWKQAYSEYVLNFCLKGADASYEEDLQVFKHIIQTVLASLKK